MAISDWFKKAKEAKEKKAKEPKKNEYGNQGAGSKAYAEAQEALEDDDKKGGGYASAD
jgi:hypothetical protein